MPQAHVAMTVRPMGEVAIIDIAGELTGFCEAVLMDAYTEASKGSASTVALNFDNLEYMNSGGIGLLVTMLIRAQRNGQELAAFGLTDHYRQIFTLTRLDEAIHLHEDEASLVGSSS